MASNPYFNFFNNVPEQNLMEDLTVESIRQYAHDVVYMPRDIVRDEIFNEPTVVTYSNALDVEMYVKNWESFQGEGQLIAKFGLEIRDQMTLVLTKRSFNQFIKPTTGKDRPWEGDCIYIPMLGATYQVRYVNSSASFYILGKNYSWEVQCDLLEFSNEQFKTGRAYIDDLNPPFENANNPDYDLESYDRTAQNEKIQTESDQIIDWTEKSPFADV